MDKEQARFILRSFRPDGADVNDQDFAEALALATANRELGEWLAAERAFDAFSNRFAAGHQLQHQDLPVVGPPQRRLRRDEQAAHEVAA